MSDIIPMIDTAQRLANHSGVPHVVQAEGDRLVVRRFHPSIPEYLEKVNPGGACSGDIAAEPAGGNRLRSEIPHLEFMP